MHSNAVSMASSVIGSMLSEESDSSPNSPRTFNIDGHRSGTVLIFARVCHLQNYKLPSRLSPIDIFDLSSFVVKYEAYEAVKLAMSLWESEARQNKDPKSIRDRALLVATAFQLDWKEAFRYWTSTIVVKEDDDQFAIELRKIGAIPERLIAFMQGRST